MQRAGPMAAFSVGTAFRLVGAAGMAVLGMTGSLPLLAGGFAIVLMSLGRSITRLAQPALAFQFAPVRAGAALGFLFGAAALGGFVGSLIGGFASTAFGFNAVNWIGAGAGAAALAILIGRLLPAYRAPPNARRAHDVPRTECTIATRGMRSSKCSPPDVVAVATFSIRDHLYE
jgi:MFS family permease